MDDEEDEFLLEAYQCYEESESKMQEAAEDELLLEAYENYIRESQPELTDDEFSLKAYQEYVNEVLEWPKLHDVEAYKIFRGEKAKPMPLLIRECARLIPTVGKQNIAYVDFHPFNMPNVPIKCINVIGIILGRQINKKYLDLKVYDGTGTITVLYKFEKYEKERKSRREINRKHGVLESEAESFARMMRRNVETEKSEEEKPNPAARQIRRVQRNYSLWWDECKQGTLGAPLDIGSYVSVYGFCNLKSNKSRRDPRSNNFWQTGDLPVLIFNAYDIKSIGEKDYNVRIQGWLKGVFALKYMANVSSDRPDEPKINKK